MLEVRGGPASCKIPEPFRDNRRLSSVADRPDRQSRSYTRHDVAAHAGQPREGTGMKNVMIIRTGASGAEYPADVVDD